MLAIGDKYACIMLEKVGCDNLKDSYDLGDGYFVVRKVPFEMDKHWVEWLGSIQMDRIRDSNFNFIRKLSSETPEIYDSENHALQNDVDNFYLGMVIQGVLNCETACLVSGGCTEEGVTARHYVRKREFRIHQKLQRQIVEGDIKPALEIGKSIKSVITSSEYGRFKRGLHSLFDGFNQKTEERLHFFARSLEALVRPEKAKTQKQFVERCKTFCAHEGLLDIFLNECFELRSYIEHMHPWDIPLPIKTSGDPDKIAEQRMKEIEHVARETYRHILTNKPLLDIFKEEATIEAFWQLDAAKRSKIFASQMKISSIP